MKSPDNMLEEIAGLDLFHGLSQVTHFQAHRRREDGSDQKVKIKIYDSGELVSPKLRFLRVAEGEDGGVATGNPGPNLKVVLHTVHWGNLDK